MRHFLVFVLLFATPGTFSELALADDIADCKQRQNSQRRISACTRLLKPGQLDAKKRATLYINRGSAFGLMRQLDKAIADFDLAIKLNPALSSAYYTRGWAYYKTGRLDKAIADFDRVIKLNPKYAKAYHIRGRANYKKGRINEAIGDYDKAIKLNPKYARAYNNRGFAYYTKGEYDKAIDDYGQATSLVPKYAHAYNNRADVYSKKGQWAQAAQDYERSLKLRARPSWDNHNKVAWAWLNAGQAAKGLGDAETAVALNPKNYHSWNMLGIIHETLGKKDQAIDAYNKAMALDPKHETSRDHLKRLGALP